MNWLKSTKVIHNMTNSGVKCRRHLSFNYFIYLFVYYFLMFVVRETLVMEVLVPGGPTSLSKRRERLQTEFQMVLFSLFLY